MNIRIRTIGDLYLASSLIFIFLTFLYASVLKRYGYSFAFFIVALLLSFIGVRVKKALILKELKSVKKKRK